MWVGNAYLLFYRLSKCVYKNGSGSKVEVDGKYVGNLVGVKSTSLSTLLEVKTEYQKSLEFGTFMADAVKEESGFVVPEPLAKGIITSADIYPNRDGKTRCS